MAWIDSLSAPLFLSWQLTRDCDLACLHCCTDSAPGKALADELSAEEALALADQIISAEVPYVMLCGGEPLRTSHFLPLAERLGNAGIQLKIETNGQLFDRALAERLARLPIRSIQISLDGDTQEVYARQRPGASLAKTHDACRAVREAGMPLEVTFAPTRLNIHEAEAVIERARALGAFRFNTGKPMYIGRAAKLWRKLAPSPEELNSFRKVLRQVSGLIDGPPEICDTPFTVQDGLRQSLECPPATLLVLPNGWVKVAAALGGVCADLRSMSLIQAWDRYRMAWRDEDVIKSLHCAITDEMKHADANNWTPVFD